MQGAARGIAQMALHLRIDQPVGPGAGRLMEVLAGLLEMFAGFMVAAGHGTSGFHRRL
jgi:hypothetical protein